jgi:hypothetical protein
VIRKASHHLRQVIQRQVLPCAFIFALTWVTCGATCIPRRTIPDFQPPPAFNAPPTTEQLAEVVNRTRNITSLQSNSVNITPRDERSVNANMTWARPKKFRMTASVAGMVGFDLGSNEDFFWMTVRNFATTPDLYYARHDEFESQIDRDILPVSPVWLIEAMGISDLDLNMLAQGPTTRPDGLVEITTFVPSPIGNYLRTIAIDPKYGYTKQIFLRDPSMRLIANAYQANHQYYPSVQTSLPHSVRVQLMPMGGNNMELDISIASYVVNALPLETMTQFTMPDTRSYNSRDLVRLKQGNGQAVSPPAVSPPTVSHNQPFPQNAYRGVPWDGTSKYR